MPRASLSAISLMTVVSLVGCSQVLGLDEYTEEQPNSMGDCNNAAKDGAESDVDCGGGCSLCVQGDACNSGADCITGSCADGKCQAPTCTDSVKNGNETGVDCGGGDCPACGGGPTCKSASDCVSGVCLNGQCAALAQWTKQFGDSAAQTFPLVRTTKSGGALLTGGYYGSIDLGGGLLTTCSGPFPDPMDQTYYCGGSVFIGAFAQPGDHLFSKTVESETDLGGANFDLKIAEDPNGDLFLAAYGWISSSFNFGTALPDPASCAPNCYEDIAVVKFDSAGLHKWSKRFGAKGDQEVKDIATHATGLVLTGTFTDSITLGGPLQSSAGSLDVFVGKLDPNGNHVWTKKFGDAGEQRGELVRVDSTGNVILTGYFKGAIDFGNGSMGSAGDYDLYLAKLNPTGDVLWRRRYGDATTQKVMKVAVDGPGNVYIAGPLAGTLDFDGTVLQGDGAKDIFVVKYSPSADLVWAKQFGPAAGETKGIDFKDMTVDTVGNVFVTGNLTGPVDFGGGALVADKPFLVKFDALGNWVWSTNAVGGQTIAAAGTNHLFLAGSFANSIEIEGQTLTSAGSNDIFLTLLANP